MSLKLCYFTSYSRGLQKINQKNQFKSLMYSRTNNSTMWVRQKPQIFLKIICQNRNQTAWNRASYFWILNFNSCCDVVSCIVENFSNKAKVSNSFKTQSHHRFKDFHPTGPIFCPINLFCTSAQFSRLC